MKNVNDVRLSIINQQLNMLCYIKTLIFQSGNLNGIPQWRDRSKLMKLIENVYNNDTFLTSKDFLFLERLHLKYKN